MDKARIIETETDKHRLVEWTKKVGKISVVYDCGARDALDGIELAVKVGAAELHVFECNPPSHRKCLSNLETYLPANISFRLSADALSDRVGEIEFHPIDIERTITPHRDGNPGASSIFWASKAYTKEKYVQSTIRVPTITLDGYCQKNASPDLLWLDVQGAELLVLRGGAAVVPKAKIIHLEIGFRKMYEGQALFKEIDRELNGHFFLAEIDVGRWPKWPNLYSAINWGPWLGNAIYINREFVGGQ
jgi:FkbM family methyltransferase